VDGTYLNIRFPDMDFYISTGIYYDRNIISVLPEFKKAGFNKVEIWTGKGKWGEEKHFKYKLKEECQRVRDEIEYLRMKVISIHAPYSNEMCLSSFDEKKQRSAVSEIKLAVDVGEIFNAEFIVIHPATTEKSNLRNYEREEHLKIFKENLKKINEYASLRKIKIAVENILPHILWGKKEDFEFLMENIENKNIFVCFDTSHAFLSGDIIDMFNSMKERIISLHISDNLKKFDDHLLPGEGKISWKEFFNELKKMDNIPYLILEILGKVREKEPSYMLPLIRKKFESFLKKLL